MVSSIPLRAKDKPPEANPHEATHGEDEEEEEEEPLLTPEEFNKYPALERDRASYRRNYVKKRRNYIRELQSHIDAGDNPDMNREFLTEYIENTPPGPPLDPSDPDPPDLPSDSRWRIRVLKSFRKAMCSPAQFDPRNIPNVNGLIRAYRSGKLVVDLSKASVWFNGVMVRGMGPRMSGVVEEEDREVYDRVDEWGELYGREGCVWIEEIRDPPARAR